MTTIYPDRFEDADLSEYTGDTAAFGTTTRSGFGAGTVLDLTTLDFNYHAIESTSGLDAYPSRGDSIVYHFEAGADDSGVHQFGFAWDTTNNEGYRVAAELPTNNFFIEAVNQANSSSASPTIGPSTEYRIEIAFDDGSVASGAIQATLYEHDTNTQLAQVSISDTTWNTGAIKWRMYHPVGMWTDSVTTPAAPANLTSTVSGDDISLDWDAVQYADEYRVYRAQSTGSTTADYTQIATTASGTTSYTDMGLLDGEQYFYRVTAVGDNESDVSNETSETTVLPAISGFSASHQSGDDIAASWTDTQDNGTYDIDYKKSTDSIWTDEATLSEATTSHTIQNLAFDTTYDVRLHGETAHTTTAFVTDQATIPPEGISSLQTTSVGETQADLSWAVTTDTEDHIRVEREEEFGSGFGDKQTLATLTADSTTYSDTTVSPNTTYRYTVTAEDATNTQIGQQDTVQVTTNVVAGTTTRSSPRSEWYAEIETDAGAIIRPRILDREPEIVPRVNGLPTIKLPVPKSDRWGQYRGATFRVYYDGVRQPVEELEGVEQTEKATILRGRGGLDLLTRVQHEYQVETASQAARDVIADTPYTADVDAFSATIQTNQAVQSADTTSEFTNTLLSPIAADVPLTVTGGLLELEQACFTREAESYDAQSGTVNREGSSYSGDGTTDGDGRGRGMSDSLDYLEWQFNVDYTIPQDDVHVSVRHATAGSTTPGIDYYLNGSKFNRLEPADFARLSGSLTWRDIVASPTGGPGDYTGGDLTPAGNPHTLRIECSDTKADTYDLDVVAVHDGRYPFNFDDTVTTQTAGHNTLSGPELYPDAVDVVFEDAETPYSVTGGRIESTWDDTTGSQAVALSNDLGDTYTSSVNTDTFETDFASTGPTVRLKVTLSRYGSRTSATPTSGFNGQSIQSFTLKADLSDEPLIVERSFDGQAQRVLSEIADAADAVWEFRRQADGTKTVTWTYPGQRQSDREVDAAAFTYDETLEGRYDKITVRGSARPVADERFTANHGTAVALAQGNILTGKAVIYDPTTNPRVAYEQGVDYELATQVGEITTLAAGSMTDAAEYAIDYQWRPMSSVDNGAADPRERVVDIPAVTTVRGAGLAAVRILAEVDTALQRGTLVVPVTALDWTVTDSLSPGVFPTTDYLQLVSAESVPGQAALTFESRQSLSGVISDVQQRLGQVTERL